MRDPTNKSRVGETNLQAKASGRAQLIINELENKLSWLGDFYDFKKASRIKAYAVDLFNAGYMVDEITHFCNHWKDTNPRFPTIADIKGAIVKEKNEDKKEVLRATVDRNNYIKNKEIFLATIGTQEQLDMFVKIYCREVFGDSFNGSQMLPFKAFEQLAVNELAATKFDSKRAIARAKER